MSSVRISPRFVFSFVESVRYGSPTPLQYASVSSRQTPSNGLTMPSSRLGLTPAARPLDTRRYSRVSTLSEAVCPVARSRSVA